MRANQKFIDEVKQTLAGMSEDKQKSYLRGLLQVGGNPATTQAFMKMWEKFRYVSDSNKPKSSKEDSPDVQPDAARDTAEPQKKRRKVRRKGY